MANKIEDILKEYDGDIDSFIEMITKIAEDEKGEQISKGKNALEKSDDEEEKEVAQDGGIGDTAAAAPASVPGEVPGANVAIGNKTFDDDKADADETQEIKLSGKQDKIVTKPQTKVNPSEYGHIDAAG
tara:strand:- start:677 stop:1063 length:387 start_codon:yes stop_codon:yes gene_type:complete